VGELTSRSDGIAGFEWLPPPLTFRRPDRPVRVGSIQPDRTEIRRGARRGTTGARPCQSSIFAISRSSLSFATSIRSGEAFTRESEPKRIPEELRPVRGRRSMRDLSLDRSDERTDNHGGPRGTSPRRSRARLRRAEPPRPALWLAAWSPEHRRPR